MNRNARAGGAQKPAICIALLMAVVMTALMTPAKPSQAQSQPPGTPFRTFVPIAQTSDGFGAVPAIWSHDAPPDAHEVSLFRHRFVLPSGVSGTQLHIFADTRYEAYLDGVLIGRGPARFTEWTHEFDVIDMPALAAGVHVLAVLVQWSPNLRRSESERPLLQARLMQGQQVLAQTGPAWRAQRSQAWRADAAPVHLWGLIGATEMLNYELLPANWAQTGFNDAGWPAAFVQQRPLARSLPRSIPPLASNPMKANVIATGLMAPDASPFSLQPNVNGEHIITFNASAPSNVLAVRTLAPAASANAPQMTQLLRAFMQPAMAAATSFTLQVTLNGQPVNLAPTADWHPDIWQATVALGPGDHTLVFRNMPASGWPMLLSLNGQPLNSPPVTQGNHAGRRLLVAQPQPIPGAVGVFPGSETLGLVFSRRNSYAVLDLGRVVHGRIEATVDGSAGSVIDIGWDERLWKGRLPLPFPGSLHPEWNQTDSWVLDGSSRNLSTLDTRTGRYLLITAWNTGLVRLTNLRIIEERYPVTQPAPDPDFGDSKLNAIWRIGRDTVKLNMTDAYADPWRERGQWWGDATVANEVNTAVFSDTALLRRGLLLMADQFRRQPSPAMAPHADEAGKLLDYTMLWVQDLSEYVSQTGDKSVLRACYPFVQEFINYLAARENAATGLLEMPQLNWWETALIDWPATFNPSGSMSHGQSTPLNAMYHGTLLAAGELAGVLGNGADQVMWQSRAARVRDSINTVLYLPAEKRYASTIIDGRVVPATLYAQAWPLAYGVVPADRKKDVADALLQMISKNPAQPNIQPYGMHWVLKALGEAGRVQEGIDLIRLYYGPLVDGGATTLWETWDANQSYFRSLSHGWGSAPTWFLSRYAPPAQPLQTVPGDVPASDLKE